MHYRDSRNLSEETMTIKSPNPGNEIDIQLRKAQRFSDKMNINRSTPKHILIKTSEVKDKRNILKVAREKQN